MKNRTGSLFMIFFLTGSIFTSMFISTPDNNIAVADTSVWENEYGRLEVEPSISTNLIRQRQWYNLTWYYSSNTVDIAFGFNDSLSYGQIYYWDGDSYNKVSTGHTTYGGQHYYTISNVAVVQDETRHGYWEYDVPAGSSGKWDMYAKLSSDSWATAFSSGRIIHLDPWWNSSFLYKKQGIIQSAYVDTNLKNFPTLVSFTDIILTNAQADGDDIAFVDSSETIQFPHEIEYFDSVTGTIVAWVNVTSVLSSSDTTIFMYYGNSVTGSQQDVVNVWDSNYIGVYHLNETSGNIVYDSTSNNNYGSYNGSMPNSIDMIAGNGQDFISASGDYIRFNGSNIPHVDETGTLELWVKEDSNVDTNTFYSDVTDSDNRHHLQGYSNTGNHNWQYRANGVGDYDVVDDGTRDTFIGFYAHRFDNTRGVLWKNISDVGSDGGGTSNPFSSEHNLTLGGSGELPPDMDGLIDEFRVSDIFRNDSWLNATYYSIAIPLTFISWSVSEEGEGTGSPTFFNASTLSISSINLSWTKGVNSTYTRIQRKAGSSPTSITDGTNVYNGTNNGFDDTGLSRSIVYYYSAWGFNSTTHNFSVSYIQDFNDTGPSNPTNIAASITGSTLNITWDIGSRSNITVIMRKTTGYPTVIGDGTEIYNSTTTGYDDTAFTTSMYYSLFAYNISKGISSEGVHVQWGVLKIHVYDENTSDAIFNYTVFVSNQTGTETYEVYSGGSQVINIDINDLPTGEDVIIRINASVYVNPLVTTVYEDRVYYMDISPNTFYNLTAYLLPTVFDCSLQQYTDSVTITNPTVDGVITFTHLLKKMIVVEIYNKSLYTTYGGWLFVASSNYSFSSTQLTIDNDILDVNTTMARVNYYYDDCEDTSSNLYRLIVYGPISEYGANPPVENAKMNIKRYINSTVGWESIGIYITDGEGNIYIYLSPGVLYKITITHDDYLTSVSDYIPSDAVFVQSFRLIPTTSDVTGITYDDFWTNITVDISIVSAGCWQDGNITVTYNDINSSTTNTQIRLFEIYGTTNTLLSTWNNASNSFFNINGSINTSRMHYIALYFNTTASYAITQPVIILIPNVDLPWCGKIVPFDLDDRISDVVGPFTIGDQEIPWTVVLGTIIPIIILVSFGPFNTGIGIIGCGISMTMLQGFLNTIVSGGFQWGVVGAGIFIVVIGIIYIMTKGTGGDHL